MELQFTAKVLIAALWQRKIVALIVFLAVVGASLSLCMLIEDRYDAEALVLVSDGVDERGSGSVVDSNGVNSLINSLARIAETNDVLREAATKVGFDRLFPNLDEMRHKDGILISMLRGLREAATKLGFKRLFPNLDEMRRKDGILIPMLRRSMSAQADGKSHLLIISFRHRDPVIAAEFVNALADSLIVRQAELLYAHVRIAQRANTPELPAFPQRTNILALGLVGGIVLGSAAALLQEALGGSTLSSVLGRAMAAGPMPRVPREKEAGSQTADVLDISDAKRLKALEDENAKLKKLLAEVMLDARSLRLR